ncbi:hypothetical protein D3C86_1891940 [compost metagenome]
MGQGDQLCVQAQAIAAEAQTIVAMVEQRTLELRFQQHQLPAQAGGLDVETAGGLHEATATGADGETQRQFGVDSRRQLAPGRIFINSYTIFRSPLVGAGFHE